MTRSVISFFISSALHAKKVSINVYKIGNSKSRTEEVTPLVKHLPCNHEDLRSISGAHVKARHASVIPAGQAKTGFLGLPSQTV